MGLDQARCLDEGLAMVYPEGEHGANAQAAQSLNKCCH